MTFFKITSIVLLCSIGFLSCKTNSPSKIKEEHVVEKNALPNAEANDSLAIWIANRDSINWLISQSSALKALRDAGLPGSVSIEIEVSRDKGYNSHTIIHSVHPLATAAVEKFIPYMRYEFNPSKEDSTDLFLVKYRYNYTTY